MLALLDMMPMQVAVISRDGTCEYVSPAVRPWLLRSRKETVGADFIESVIPSLRDQSVPDGQAPRRVMMSWQARRVMLLEWQGALWVPFEEMPRLLAD